MEMGCGRGRGSELSRHLGGGHASSAHIARVSGLRRSAGDNYIAYRAGADGTIDALTHRAASRGTFQKKKAKKRRSEKAKKRRSEKKANARKGAHTVATHLTLAELTLHTALHLALHLALHAVLHAVLHAALHAVLHAGLHACAHGGGGSIPRERCFIGLILSNPPDHKSGLSVWKLRKGAFPTFPLAEKAGPSRQPPGAHLGSSILSRSCN
ncbi:hypothetical protein T492DRAFT_233506 [Pavlovales sp. CCMP2436]|nr:hypothetical protein T492DRAFT_233506 [Pavlovales sp. CCMP2436]